MGSLIKAASDLASAGLAVFPVRPGRKQPALRDWQALATTDPGEVSRLFRGGQAFNIGIATGGRSGGFVLDIDRNRLWFRQIGNNLEISVVGSTDKTIIQDWYTASANQVEFIRDDLTGYMTDATKISALVGAMSQFSPQDMSLANTPSALIAARDNAWTIA